MRARRIVIDGNIELDDESKALFAQLKEDFGPNVTDETIMKSLHLLHVARIAKAAGKTILVTTVLTSP